MKNDIIKVNNLKKYQVQVQGTYVFLLIDFVNKYIMYLLYIGNLRVYNIIYDVPIIHA